MGTGAAALIRKGAERVFSVLPVFPCSPSDHFNTIPLQRVEQYPAKSLIAVFQIIFFILTYSNHEVAISFYRNINIVRIETNLLINI